MTGPARVDADKTDEPAHQPKQSMTFWEIVFIPVIIVIMWQWLRGSRGGKPK